MDQSFALASVGWAAAMIKANTKKSTFILGMIIVAILSQKDNIIRRAKMRRFLCTFCT